MGGKLLGKLVLPADVVLEPVAQLPEALRRGLPDEAGSWALTRRGLRAPSRLVDARGAALLGEFRAPSSVVEAVLRFARARGEDPEAALEEAFGFLAPFVARGFLLPEGAAGPDGPSFLPGARIAGTTVLSCLKAIEDVELYRVRAGGEPAFLKLAREAGPAPRLEGEATVLANLEGRGAPRLLATGEAWGRRFLLLSWVAGVDAARAAAELRRVGDRAGLLALALALARASAELHGRGILHGDVHPGNVLIDGTGAVTLVDFGYARDARDPHASPDRGGIPFYYEPEQAAAILAGSSPPPASFAGEQYALAALLYLLFTGRHRRDFSLAREEMLAELATASPLPFAERGALPWPEVEEILERALSMDPANRFPGVAALAAALAQVPPPPAAPAVALPGAQAFLPAILERFDPEGPLFRQGLPPPRAAVAYGAAGVAAALYRVACAREDAHLLAAADLWAEKAAAEAGGEDAFRASDLALRGAGIGGASLFHGRAGIAVVRGQIARARADAVSFRHAAGSFLEASRGPAARDLTDGQAGLLTGIALLIEGLDAENPARAQLLESGRQVAADLLQALAGEPPLAALLEPPDLGLAHGRAGFLYGLLLFSRAAGDAVPTEVADRLAELAALAEPRGRGLAWPWEDGRGDRHGPAVMAGWCGGSAGFVHLFCEAHAALGGDWLRLAQGAAWQTWEGGPENGTLCCGLAGRAYALARFARASGETAWLPRARELAARAVPAIARTAERRDCLLKGELGVAAAIADLENPEGTAMPVFESEGWE